MSNTITLDTEEKVNYLLLNLGEFPEGDEAALQKLLLGNKAPELSTENISSESMQTATELLQNLSRLDDVCATVATDEGIRNRLMKNIDAFPGEDQLKIQDALSQEKNDVIIPEQLSPGGRIVLMDILNDRLKGE